MDKFDKEKWARQVALDKEAEELEKILSRYFNTFQQIERFKTLSGHILNDHRTLQQTIMRFFIYMIKEWAETPFFDGRNEATIKLCRKIVEQLADDLYLPNI